jgi:FHS family L-fucose permease-like MFS transporter
LQLWQTFKRLARIRHYRWGVVAQFFYVGAQIGVWSFTIRYVMQEIKVTEEGAASYYIAALILFTVGRFVSTWLMRYLTPARLLLILSGVAMGFTLLVIFGRSYVGVVALVAISACMSLMFPTIFGLSVRGLGEDTKIGGSGLIMAILGGAVLTALQGQVSDALHSIHLSYFVPFVCFVVIAAYSLMTSRMTVKE